MYARHFGELLEAQSKAGKFLCVGLDPDSSKLPPPFQKTEDVAGAFLSFNRAIIDATKRIVGAYKPNSAFYEALGADGWRVLRETIRYANEVAPDVPIILDAKRGDIGNTNNGYVTAAFDYLGADALTVHPYMGGESLTEFFARKEKGIFVMCRNSNPGAGEFQDLEINGEPLYVHVARAFTEKWNSNGNCGLVVGATFQQEIARVRSVAPNMPLLIPGMGAQGGDLERSVQAGKDAERKGLIISVSRAVLYASAGIDFANAAATKAQEFDSAIRSALLH